MPKLICSTKIILKGPVLWPSILIILRAKSTIWCPYFNAHLHEQTVSCRAKTNPLFYHLKNFISEGHEVGNEQTATFKSSFFQSTIILELWCRFFSHRTISKLKQSLGARKNFKVYCTKEYKPKQVGHSPGIRHPGSSPAPRTV